jgi:2-acylglycerol O-acyltransferase 2
MPGAISTRKDIWESFCVLVMLLCLPFCLWLTWVLVSCERTRLSFLFGYLIWRVIDRQAWWGGRMCPRPFFDPIARGIRSYFDAEVKYIDVKSLKGVKGPMIFCCHPHGIFGISTLLNFAVGSFSGGLGSCLGRGVHVLTLRLSFLIPFWRDFLVSFGLGPVDRGTCEFILREVGDSIAVVLGGAREALRSRPGVYEIILRNRLGLFKLSVGTGCPVVPTFSFGEVDLYDQVTLWWPFSLLQLASIRLLGFSVPLPVGRFGSLLPFRRKLLLVIGTPIYPDPGMSAVELSEKYIVALKDLYLSNRPEWCTSELTVI